MLLSNVMTNSIDEIEEYPLILLSPGPGIPDDLAY